MTDVMVGDVPMHPLLFVLGGGSFMGSLTALLWVLPSLGGWAFLLAGIVLTAVILAWMAFVELGADAPSPQDYPKSYSCEREFQGYRISVDIVERSKYEIDPWRLEREVTATAVDESGETITQVDSSTHAGRLPRYVFDSPLEEGSGMSAGDQTRRVLEDVYDDILEYDSTGAVGDVSGVESALDVVFGEGVDA